MCLKCIDVGNTRVFGVDLKDLKARTNSKMLIPTVIQNTISHLDCFGLEIEGIFRKSGSASQIEYFKDQFDQGFQLLFITLCLLYLYWTGVDVDLKSCPDPHTVAGLLKLYLRELPEPLLSFDLYDKFINSTLNGKQEILLRKF